MVAVSPYPGRDSLGMVMLGYETTLPVTMTEMLHHTAAVARAPGTPGSGRYAVLSYHVSIAQALENAGNFSSRRCGAVKIEGGALRAELVKTLAANGIPVMSHIALRRKVFAPWRLQGRRTATEGNQAPAG